MANTIMRFSFWMMACGVLGASAVAIGAVGSHVVANPVAAASIEKASAYQLWHVLAILASLMMSGQVSRVARLLFLIGILLFSGSIYAKYFFGIHQAVSMAPAGGVAMILGWLALGCSSIRVFK